MQNDIITTKKAKSSFFVGSLKKGYMEIKLDEVVNVVKISRKTIYVEKNGLVKAFNIDLFY